MSEQAPELETASTYGRLRTNVTAQLLRPRRPHANTLIVLGAFAGSLCVTALVVAAIGISPWEGLKVLVQGSVGSISALGDSLVFATPRLFVALGVIVAVRCGVFNLGGEGQLQFGAVGAVLVATLSPIFAPLQVALALMAAMACGAGWAAIAALLKIWRGADEIIVTLMLNFIAIYFVSYLVEGPLRPKGAVFNQSAQIAHSAQLPIIVSGTRLHAGFALAVVCVIFVWVLLYRTTLGLKLRATGLSPRAARLQGLSPRRLVLISMAISGAISGLAGAGEVLGVQYRLIEGFSSNFGFDGLAIAFLGGLEPFPVLLVAVYFGILQNGTTALQDTLSVPAAIVYIMEGLPIVALASAQGWLLVRGRSVSA